MGPIDTRIHRNFSQRASLITTFRYITRATPLRRPSKPPPFQTDQTAVLPLNQLREYLGNTFSGPWLIREHFGNRSYIGWASNSSVEMNGIRKLRHWVTSPTNPNVPLNILKLKIQNCQMVIGNWNSKTFDVSDSNENTILMQIPFIGIWIWIWIWIVKNLFTEHRPLALQ